MIELFAMAMAHVTVFALLAVYVLKDT